MSAPGSIADFLKTTELFKTFTPTGLQIIAGISQQKSLPAGTPLFVEAMIGEALFVILEGEVRVGLRGPDGVERFLRRLGPGESLGEASILRVGPRMCSATAETNVKVIEITRRDIAALQKSKPQACLKLMMAVVELIGTRMHDTDAELRQFVAWCSA